MLFQVLCGFEPIFYTTHPNEEPKIYENMHDFADILKQRKLRKRLKEVRCRMKQSCALFLCKIYSNYSLYICDHSA